MKHGSRRSKLSIVPVFALACASGFSPWSETPALAGPQTAAQHITAHFRTPDGMIGVVLDRSGAKPKYQLDGQKDVIELTQKPQRETWKGRLQGYFFITPDGTRAFFIDTNGGITYLPDSDGYGLTFDKDVTALGAATKTGEYKAPAPAYQATVDKLTAIAVRTRFPSFKPEDSANLKQIAAAMDKATPDMVVHYAARGTTNTHAIAIAPSNMTGFSYSGVGYTSDDKWDPKATGLAKYGGRNQGWSHIDTPKGNHLQVMTLQGYPPKLADGMPGLIWEIDGTRALFVAADGGRYEIDVNKPNDEGFDTGAGSSWPTPAQDALLTVTDVSSLAKVGELPQQAVDDLAAVDSDWTTCAAKVWQPMVDKEDAGKPVTVADEKATLAKTRTTCAGLIKKQEAMVLAIVDQRHKDRVALYTKNKGRMH